MVRSSKLVILLGFVTPLSFLLSPARAECDPRVFMVQDVTSIQQSGDTELAFVLTSSQSEYENAKKNFGGSGAYGLFSAALSWGDAKERAHQISQATKFDYKSSYASNYVTQSLSPRAQDSYVQCLEKDKSSPGLALWLQRRDGDYFTFRAYWIGSDTGVPAAKYDSEPLVDGGAVISKPTAWLKAKTEEIVVKRNGNNQFFLRLQVGGETTAKVVVQDPPAVVWLKELVASPTTFDVHPNPINPHCGFGTATDTIHPTHPGGYFVANTRTTNHASQDESTYRENFTVDRPDQVTVSVTQSTGACENTWHATGRLQAMETYPVAAQ
jgi:hypothetical protein